MCGPGGVLVQVVPSNMGDDTRRTVVEDKPLSAAASRVSCAGRMLQIKLANNTMQSRCDRALGFGPTVPRRTSGTANEP